MGKALSGELSCTRTGLVAYIIRELVWFTVCDFHELLSACVCASFPFGFEGGV